MEKVVIEYWYTDPDAVLEYGTFQCSYDQGLCMISILRTVYMEDLFRIQISFITNETGS